MLRIWEIHEKSKKIIKKNYFSLVPVVLTCLLLPWSWWLFPNSSLLKWWMFSQALSLLFFSYRDNFCTRFSWKFFFFSIQKFFSHSKIVWGQKMQISVISAAFSGVRKSIWSCEFAPALVELLPTCRSLCAPGVHSLCRTCDGTGNVWISIWRTIPLKDSMIQNTLKGFCPRNPQEIKKEKNNKRNLCRSV